MTQQNPLRILAGNSKFGVDAGTGTLVANGIYGVEDVVRPILTSSGIQGDPRLFVSNGRRKVRVKWRKVNHRGWIGPKAQQAKDKDTIIQIKFQRRQKLNFISFELLKVPQVWSVHYYDPSRKRMVKLSDAKGHKVEGALHGFKANVIAPGKDPSHKWRAFSFDLPKVRTNLVEIRLNRDLEENADFFGLPKDTPYSLGLRNLRIKFKKISDDDDDDDFDGTPSPIFTNERPLVVRHTSRKSHDGQDTTYWECAPQGAASSVVPFYLDLRAADGGQSIFDILKMKPLWPGPSMVAYSSSDDATSPWIVSGNRVNLVPDGGGSPGFVEDSGLLVDSADASWIVSNDAMRVDLSRDFVAGLQFTPTSTSSTDRWLWVFEDDDASHTLGLKFDWAAGEFKVIQNGGGSPLYTSGAYSLEEGKTYGVVLGYNRSDLDSRFPTGWYLSTSVMPATNSTVKVEGGIGTAPDIFFPSVLRIGNSTALTGPSLGYLSRLWVRLDSFADSVARNYLKNPDPFIMGDGDPDQRVYGFHCAVLVARLQKTIAARVGPGANYFRAKEWTPIPIDYTLSTTQYKLPLTVAKFLKLEFTNLAPRLYLTSEEELIVTDYPAWVRNWYRAGIRTSDGVPYNPATSPNYFEGQTNIGTPGDPSKLPPVRAVLEGRGVGLPPIIYHGDQATVDLAVSPDSFDGSTLYREPEFATHPMRFYRTTRHDYEIHFVQAERHAFFVGIKELQVFRSDQAALMDVPEYNETYDDDKYIDYSSGFTNVGGSMQSAADGDSITSVTFESFSKFSAVQVAVLDSGWESAMSPSQIDLGTITHLTDPDDITLASSSTTDYSIVTGQYLGARGGNVIQVNRLANSAEAWYGVRTAIGAWSGSAITGDNPRTSVVARIQLPQTNLGTYELHLYAFDAGLTQVRRLVASRPIKIPVRSWKEVEIVYVASAGEEGWQAEIVQVDPSVSEPLIVDMLGIWQNPIKWEFSNDDGGTWQTIAWPLNKPNGYLRFPEADNLLKVRVTALRANALVSGWSVVPWYIESSMVVRAPIDYYPPWGVSDDQDLLDTSHKPMFMLWSHYFPQRYSVNLLGLPITTTL